MKRLIVIVFALIIYLPVSFAQTELNLSPDSIVGEYEVLHQGEYAKVRIVKDADSTYSAQIYWVDDMYDKHGALRLDRRNPDKSMRGVPCSEIVLMKGLKYDSKKERWSGTTIYDPTRGFRCPVVCEFRKEKGLRVRLSFLCFVQSCYWQKMAEKENLE